MSTPDILQIEAFSDGLRGKKILQYVSATSRNSLINMVEADATEPFARKVLLTAAAKPAMELFRTQWDAIFNITDTREWVLIATYIVNAPKPMCVVCEEGAELPEVVMKRIAGIHGVTVICQRMLAVPVRSAGKLYDIIFMPMIDDPGSADATTILAHMGVLEPGHEDRRIWLKELRVAGAGLVWSRGTGICWYDNSEVVKSVGAGAAHNITKMVGAHLRVLADSLDRV